VISLSIREPRQSQRPPERQPKVRFCLYPCPCGYYGNAIKELVRPEGL
jgi:hypothetical protein